MVIHEPAREVPVVHTCDVCVIGGSCTGVFAAVRAAQRGATVALVELGGYFGGTATAGLVNVWHSLYDTEGKRQIIAGLTQEVLDRLMSWGAAKRYDSLHHQFNSAALVLELDDLVRSHPSVRPFLHTRFVAPVVQDGYVTHAVIEDKTGRRAIQARCFVDASGDGDLAARAGLPFLTLPDLQPPTACVHIYGIEQVETRNPGFDLGAAVHDPQWPEALQKGMLWAAGVPGVPGLHMVAGTRVHHADCSDADALTRAEMEGRRQVRAMLDILRTHYAGGEAVMPAAVAAYIGVRETRHYECLHRLTEAELLEGTRFPDAIANGTYEVDIHHSDREGITQRFLNGTEKYYVPGKPLVWGRWREPREVDPTFYQIPYRCLVPQGARNLLVAGRLLDADRGAYGAARVMVNANQTGEAAGLACALAAESGCEVADVDVLRLQQALNAAGAIVGEAV